MESNPLSYESFLLDVSPTQRPFVDPIHALLAEKGCAVKLQMAKNGYVVSYSHKPSKRVVANFIFRKQGLMIRVYGDHCGKYQPFFDGLPVGMKESIQKAANCRRLLDPAACNARCPLGNVLALDGAVYKKCRYDCFVFPVDGTTAPHLLALLEKELEARSA